MKNKERTFVAVLAATFVLVLAVTAGNTGDEWERSFEKDDTNPYGSRMLFETLPALFQGDRRVTPVDLSIYEMLADTVLEETAYLFVTSAFVPDREEAEKLLDFLEAGNQVFIAASTIDGFLADTLGFEMTSNIVREGSVSVDSLRINFVNPALARPGGYLYDAALIQRVFAFNEAGGVRATALGTFEASGDPNFVRLQWGRGVLYLSSVPLAFTNYNMLTHRGAEYTYGALSYLPPDSRLFWDEYYKPLRSQARTPLRFLLSTPALRSSLYLALASLALFFVFHGKRRQRPIPVIEKPANTTVEFVETVGLLYYNQGNHRNIAQKMIQQWRHYARTHLLLEASGSDTVSPERLAARAGVELETVSHVLDVVKATEEADAFDELMLHRLAEAFDAFYRESSAGVFVAAVDNKPTA